MMRCLLLHQLKPPVPISPPSWAVCSKIWSLLLGLLQSTWKNFNMNCTSILIKPRWIIPFGLHSAPYIFSSFADLLVWILTHNYGINFLLHYLDDFNTLGPPNSPVCQNNVNTCVQLFSEWGIPLHPDKLEGPSTCYRLAFHRTSLITLPLFWNPDH